MALICLLVSGCGFGGSGSPEIPEGFKQASTKHFTFAYPKNWKRLPRDSYPKGWPVAFGKDGKPGAEVAAFTQLPDTSDPKLAIETVLTRFQHTHNFERKKDRAIDIPTVAEAWRIDYTYNAEDSHGGLSEQEVLGTDVAVVDDAQHVMLVRITRYPGGVEASVVNQIVSSIAAANGT